MIKWGKSGRKQATPALDAAYLERLERHIGRDTLLELMADGLMEVSDRLGALASRAGDGARSDALRLGHDLAGLAGHLGLSALSAAAVEMNRTARAEPEAPIAPLAAPVLTAGEAAEAALRAAYSEALASRGVPRGLADTPSEAPADSPKV